MWLSKTTIAFLLSLCTILTTACDTPSAISQQPNEQQLTAAEKEKGDSPVPKAWKVGAPLTHANLTIYPVQSNTPNNDDLYITLQEGLKSGQIQVFELGAPQETDSGDWVTVGVNGSPAEDEENANDESAFQEAETDNEPTTTTEEPELDSSDEYLDAEVERVLVRNDSEKPLYLMPGEIILGGQQDRCVAQEMVIQPGGEPVTVEVYCVEPGRWSGRSTEELAFFAQSVAEDSQEGGEPNENASEAEQAHKFTAVAGVLNKRGRLAVQATKDQSAVWDEVRSANEVSGNKVASDSFTGNYADPKIIASLAPYCQELEKQVSERENIVGIVVVINGQIENADVFASTPLFRKLWPKLLQSYAFDAATNFADDADEEPMVAKADVERFLHDIETAQTERASTEHGLVLSSRTSEDGSGEPFVTSILPVDSEGNVIGGRGVGAAFGGGGLGGLGGAVHTSGFAQ